MSDPAPAPPRTPILRADNVFRTFQIGANRIEVLRGVTLSVERGERLFLRGASGAGKTSLLYTLAGLERPNEGAVYFDGEPLYGQSPNRQARIRNRRMGYVFQNYSLLPELTALENVLMPSLIGGERDAARARDLLERVGLGARVAHLPNEMSGGEQQRVAIARALMNDPEVIFADEPTGNLDSKTGGGVMDLLLGVISEQRKTLVVVTHDSALAESGDRRVELADGRLRG
ncbi:MAG: ABC transporter ATP-binding protein [Akkermansiaceae bacterium]|nr:ABC transporter ATP-binding protein [Akkermansiaceae bacterium]MCP5549785.1 ABC transporter ATP-binding protein [Akkermansiaceae bacterium]